MQMCECTHINRKYLTVLIRFNPCRSVAKEHQGKADTTIGVAVAVAVRAVRRQGRCERGNEPTLHPSIDVQRVDHGCQYVRERMIVAISPQAHEPRAELGQFFADLKVHSK